ncbi:outer membrane lipoprotein carrier protein LolA [Vibrio genomosp. F6]|uniref:LolA family protein n=1 Tax=Vibrio genomosp. F6 TaxID=723172 RepID=UPI0010BD61D0|nr:outer membrane lipoprotein carrier protein LolA [Vibrio genomosp. F6]TKF22701.1 outer membrane lipoprotein carrier protein LolA [Vibrio genomosp. F6]
MKKHVFLGLLLALSSTTSCTVNAQIANAQTAIAINSLEALKVQLSSHDIVRGDFSQERSMEMFSEPLSSQGRFILDKNSGLLWHQTSPFPVDLVLTNNKLSQSFANQKAQVITPKENPMAFYFSHIFLSVFHGNTEQLMGQFELSFTPQEQAKNTISMTQWSLILIPKNPPLSSVFKSIVLRGRQDIESIALEEVRGDKTEIQFSNQTHQPEFLTDAEQAQFQF